jgi:hypothetical protein
LKVLVEPTNSLGNRVHVAAAVIFCAAFVVIGGKQVGQIFTVPAPIPPTPPTASHSTDAYLMQLTGMQNGSQQLLKMFGSLPASRPLYVFVREDKFDSSFVGALVAYLGWPARFRCVAVRPNNASGQLRAVDPLSCGAIVFYGMKPPDWLQPQVAFSPNLSIVPVRQEGERRP